MKILVVDDQRGMRRLIMRILSALPDVEVIEADSMQAGLAAAERDLPDLVLLDIRLSGNTRDRTGLVLLGELRSRLPAVHVVMVTAASELNEVRAAMRLGATDYILKDELSPELMLPVVQGVRERITLRGEVVRLRARVNRLHGLSAIVGASPAMDRVRDFVRRVANADATVLIRGETGAGKELVARTIHELSPRNEQPFVAINCSALPHALMESLIFGHERGAFTGAAVRAKGQLELAGGGTVLLDEIAEMPLDLQAKLLRVIEDRTFRPLGAAREMTLAARLLVATHADLEQRIQQGRFREDLFFRINVLAVAIPPLAEREQDIPELVHALASASPRRLRFTDDAMAWLSRRRWPGNVRELRNVIERVAILGERDEVTPAVLEALAGDRPVKEDSAVLNRLVALVLAAPAADGGNKLEMVERAILQQAVVASDGNKSAAARLIGIPRKALERRWQRFGEGATLEADDEDEG
jgi:DNA-binding NtrC family response regulator